MTKKKESKQKECKERQSPPEMTALEKRLAEKVALEPEDELSCGPSNLNEAQQQIDELNERFVRLTADYDNYRKRAQRIRLKHGNLQIRVY